MRVPTLNKRFFESPFPIAGILVLWVAVEFIDFLSYRRVTSLVAGFATFYLPLFLLFRLFPKLGNLVSCLAVLLCGLLGGVAAGLALGAGWIPLGLVGFAVGLAVLRYATAFESASIEEANPYAGELEHGNEP